MVQRPKILIFISLTGGGHLSLAQALQDMLDEQYDIEIIDPYPPIFHQIHTSVGSGSHHFLPLWELEYKISNTEQAAFAVHKLLAALLQRRLRALIERIKPQLIITTHTLLSYEVAQAIKQNATRVPLVFQLSELAEIHATWLTEKHAGAYLVPTQEILAQARARGIDESRLHLTGMPVRKQFLQDYSATRSETLAAFGFDPAVFTVFLQGGAEGAAGIKGTIKNILAGGKAIQIILAAGKSKQLATRFTNVPHLKVLPYTQTIAPFMAASDVIMGKAGPNFIAEAVMLGKPFLATAFIPGLEAPNLPFLERHNLGWVCLEKAAQPELIITLASNPSMLAEKVKAVLAYRAWNMQANQSLYPLIAGLLPPRHPVYPTTSVPPGAK